MILKAPFPYFGGKSKTADMVWQRLGDVDNYIEPFAGTLATLLRRPNDHTGKVGNENKTRERIWFSPHCLSDGGAFGLFAKGGDA